MSLKIVFVLWLAVCGANTLRLQRTPKAATDEQVNQLAESLESLVNALDDINEDAATELGVDIIIVEISLFLPTAIIDVAEYNDGDPTSIICYADTAVDLDILDLMLAAMDLWVSLVAHIDDYVNAVADCELYNETEDDIDQCNSDVLDEFSESAMIRATLLNDLLDPVVEQFDVLEMCL